MKLTYSILLLAAAAGIQASLTPRAPTGSCVSGVEGLGNGDGYNGACCKDQSDCIDDCVKGVCNGPQNTKTTTTTKATTKTTTTGGTVPTNGACTPGSSGLGNGDGYNGACCKNQADCVDDCVKGVCNGPTNTKTTATIKTTTSIGTRTTTGGTTPTTGACSPGSSGLGNGDGYNGACCKDQSDCVDDCVKGVCNGPQNTKTTTKPTTKTTTTSGTTPTTGTCSPGSSGLGNGDGYNGACCKDQADCVDDCVKGVCNGPKKPSATTKTVVKAKRNKRNNNKQY